MNTFDSRWEEVHCEKDWGKYPSEEVIRFVARNYYKKVRSEVKILDIGCGAGANTWFLAREGFDVYALDGSQTAIEKANKRLQNENLKAKFNVCDAGNMNYQDSSFDAIIDSALIVCNKLDGIRHILNQCFLKLKKDGKLFSTGLFMVGMTGYGLGEKLEEHTYRQITEGSLSNIGTVHFFDDEQINKLWAEAGFRNIKIDSLERTDFGGAIKTSYYIVEAQK